MSTVATVPASPEDLNLSPLTMSSTEQPEYCFMLTDAGIALEAQAKAEGKTLKLTTIAVGDGNGAVPTPSSNVTALVNEVYRKAIDNIKQDQDDLNICWLHMVIPADEGGWFIREAGVFAEKLDGSGDLVLYAYGNQPPYYKTKRISGNVATYELSIPIVVTSTSSIEIVIAEDGYATRDALLELEESMLCNYLDIAINLVKLSDRFTKDRLSRIENNLPGGVVVVNNINELSASGVTGSDGVTVSPISICDPGEVAAPNAALVLQMENYTYNS